MSKEDRDISYDYDDWANSGEDPFEDTFVCHACGGTFPLPAIRIWGDRDPNDEIALCHECFQAIAGELV